MKDLGVAMDLVLVSWGGPKNVLQTEWFKTTEIHSHLSGGQKPEVRVSPGTAHFRGSEGEPSPCLSLGFWQSLAFLGL